MSRRNQALNDTTIRVPIFNVNFLPCIFEHLFPTSKCPKPGKDVERILSIFSVLFPGRNTRFIPVDDFFPSSFATKKNDSSELGHLDFGLADITLPYYSLNPGRAARLPGFLGPLKNVYLTLYYHKDSASPRLEISLTQLLPSLYQPLIVFVGAVFLVHGIYDVVTRNLGMSKSKTVEILWVFLIWSRHLTFELVVTQLQLVFMTFEWSDPLDSLEGFLNYYETGKVRGAFDYGSMSLWQSILSSEGGSPLVRRFKSAIRSRFPSDIPFAEAKRTLEQNKALVYLTSDSAADFILDDRCILKATVTSFQTAIQGSFSRFSPYTYKNKQSTGSEELASSQVSCWHRISPLGLGQAGTRCSFDRNLTINHKNTKPKPNQIKSSRLPSRVVELTDARRTVLMSSFQRIDKGTEIARRLACPSEPPNRTALSLNEVNTRLLTGENNAPIEHESGKEGLKTC